jgi:glutathione synthase/RimK-type ligase-like ATP-grasp enzyme
MKKIKNIVVVYFGSDWKRKIPLPKAIPTRVSFEDWHERGLRNGVAMYRASINWYDAKKNIFKKSWAYRNKKWIKITTPVKPDLIFDKIMGKRDYQMFNFKMDLSKKTKIFNHPLFRTMTDNKLAQYLILGEFMPKSILAVDKEDLPKALKKIPSSKVVIKPLYGSGGFGIIIGDKNKIKKSKIEYPVFIQEFIRSEKGIPGFSKNDQVADLRMVFMNHKLIYALSRIAKKGSLFTNFHQGATAVLVPEKNIPASVKKMSREIIDKKLGIFSKANYSLDFIFTNSGEPILVEMNTTPGFDLLHIVGDEKIKDKNFKEFISVLKP